jgi:hypothetical protein
MKLNSLDQVVMLLTFSPKVTGLNIDPHTRLSSLEYFMVFVSHAVEMSGVYLKLDLDCFVQHPFQFIVD